MARLAIWWVAFGILAASAPGWAAGEPSSAERVVSLNLCADQMLVLVARPGQIVGLSHLAVDPELSFVAGRARMLPIHGGSAEEILALAPDLVLAGAYQSQAVLALVRSRGIRVLTLELAESFGAIRDQIRAVASALATPEANLAGEGLITEMDQRLAAARPPALSSDHIARPDGVGGAGGSASPRPLAVAWQAGGFAAGAGTLIDAVLDQAGIDNLAGRQGLVGYGYLALESVVAARPDFVIADAAKPALPSLAQRLLVHPALAARHARRGEGPGLEVVSIPAAWWACGVPAAALAVERLARYRRAAVPGPQY